MHGNNGKPINFPPNQSCWEPFDTRRDAGTLPAAHWSQRKHYRLVNHRTSTEALLKTQSPWGFKSRFSSLTTFKETLKQLLFCLSIILSTWNFPSLCHSWSSQDTRDDDNQKRNWLLACKEREFTELNKPAVIQTGWSCWVAQDLGSSFPSYYWQFCRAAVFFPVKSSGANPTVICCLSTIFYTDWKCAS